MSQKVHQPKVIYDDRWKGPHGIGRFATELAKRIPGLHEGQLKGSPTNPLDTLKLSWKLLGGNQVFYSPGFNAPLGRPCPFVFTIHDLIHVNYPAEASAAKRLYYTRVVKPAARRAFKVLTVSEFSKAEIVAWAGVSPEQVEVVYNGVSPDFAADGPTHQPGYDYLFFVGNQKPHKNLSGLLKAMPQIRKAADLHLLVTGAANESTSSLIHQLGLESVVHFQGRMSDDALARTYRGAAATVLASEYEGFGLPVVESMACGTPVVCSNVTSLPEVAGDAAELVDTDPASIAHGVLNVMTDADRQAELVSRGLTRAAEFTWDATASRVQHVLNQLVANCADDLGAAEAESELCTKLEASAE